MKVVNKSTTIRVVVERHPEASQYLTEQARHTDHDGIRKHVADWRLWNKSGDDVAIALITTTTTTTKEEM